MSTPFGAQMRPMIEQMFVGRRTATAGRADIGRLASQLGGGGGLPTPAPTPTSTPPSAESVSSNLQIVTSAASLRSTLASAPSVIVLYTHAHASAPSPSPSASSKQTFESLAPKYARTKFVLVETHLARGGPGEFADLGLVHGGDEGGSEMLALFAQSRCVRSIPSPGERIEDQVKWLEDRLWPEHPHAALGLSQIDALQREVMPTWRSVPKKEGLEKKLLDEVVGEGDEREVMRGLVERVFEAAAARGGEVVEVREREWIAAIEFVEALSGAPKLDAPLFPLIDLLRLAFSLPATSSNVSPTTLTYLPRLLTTLSTTLHTRSTSHPSLETDLVTSLKLVSNLVSPAIQPRALTARIPAPDCVPSVTRLVLHALLLEGESEKLRLVAAQTALALVVRVGEECRWSDEEGAAGEEWEVEVASAVVEALASAVERGAGVEIRESARAFTLGAFLPSSKGTVLISSACRVLAVHPLTATLGAVLFRSPHFSSTLSLLEVLDADVVLARVEERVKGEKRTSELVGEVRRLIKSGAAGEDEA